MEQSLEQTVQTLVAQMELSEKRYQQAQKRSRWLGMALVLSVVVSLSTVMFKADMIEEAQAETTMQSQAGMQLPPEAGKLIQEMTTFFQALNAPQTQEAMGHLVAFINSPQTHGAFTNMTKLASSIEVEKVGEALTELDDIIIGVSQALKSGKITDEIRKLYEMLTLMSRDMHVMAVDMHRMSSTATPAMGQMYDIMRFMPTPP